MPFGLALERLFCSLATTRATSRLAELKSRDRLFLSLLSFSFSSQHVVANKSSRYFLGCRGKCSEDRVRNYVLGDYSNSF